MNPVTVPCDECGTPVKVPEVLADRFDGFLCHECLVAGAQFDTISESRGER